MAAINVKSTALAALTTAALNLPGLATAAVPVDRASGNVQYGHYQESDKRMEVDVYHADGIVPVGDRLELTYSIDQDTYSGATPNFSAPASLKGLWVDWPRTGVQKSFNIPQDVPDTISAASAITHLWMLPWPGFKEFQEGQDQAVAAGETDYYKVRAAGYRALTNRGVPQGDRIIQSFQQQPRETRNMPVLGLKYYFDAATVALSGGVSDEPDYYSTFGNVTLSKEFNNKLTTISGGYGATSNEISRNTGHNAHGGHRYAVGADYPVLQGDSTFHNFNLGLSQVLTKNTLWQLNTSFTHQTGYLTNPYKVVYVRGEITPEEYAQHEIDERSLRDITKLEVVGFDLFREVRPNQRNQWAISTGIKQYIPAFDAALHADYRYYLDDWGIDSHTFEVSWLQPLPSGFTIKPNIRYYSQSQADFFAPYFLAPRADGHYSSDFRLSGYGALSGGLTVTKQFTKGISLEAGFEYYTHQGGLKLGGGGTDAYADYDSYLAHAGLKVDLSAPGQPSHEGHQHHQHQHGSHAPAGLMYAHMLEQPGEVMMGYRYMFSRQSDGMWRGSHPAADQAIVNNVIALNPAKQIPPCRPAFADIDCSITKPTAMTMHMHMLDIMYAPTDWLNLMLMPQLVNMDMDMATLQEDTNNGHTGSHVSNGLGDTLMAALVKVYADEHHHLHAGIGWSAPTGSITQSMNGVDSFDSDLQSYGMQLGSGTWDFQPSLTYTGRVGDWSWGAQALAVKRLEKTNRLGYALGDIFQGSAWGGYNFTPWLAASVRGVYTSQGAIRGQSNRNNLKAAPIDFPGNYGGQFWDVGFGLNASAPSGSFAGHNLGIEWLQPVANHYNGYQLGRDGSLSVTWSYMF